MPLRSRILRRFCSAALISAAHQAVAAHAHAQSPTVTASRTGSSRAGFDVLHYDFRVDFPARPFPDTIAFTSVTTVNRTGSGVTLALDLTTALVVDSTTVNGRPASFTRSPDSVVVALPPGRGDTLLVAVFYRGLPTDGLITRGDATAGWTAFADNFPDRARHWIAAVDHPSDKATVDWVVRAPATHRVIANGELVEESPEPTATFGLTMMRTHWRETRPIYTAVMVIGVAPMAVLELGETACGLAERPGCVRQSVWTRPADRASMPGAFARAGEMVSLFARRVAPFPYEKLAHVSSATRYGGMENAAAIFYAEAAFKGRTPDEETVAHEIAHQWFGDAVTTREWPHVWLSEGFATYFTALWIETAHGDSAFRAHLEGVRRTVLDNTITWQKAIIDTTLDDLTRVLNTNVYEKAGFSLHLLRREVGDSAFFRGIRRYYAAHRHGNALTADLQRAIEREAGRNLDWFFTQWFQRPGVAQLDASWTWAPETKQLQVTVRQGTRVPPYRLTLTADVTDARGKTRRITLAVPAREVTTLTVPWAGDTPPRKVTFDPDVSLLGTVRTR